MREGIFGSFIELLRRYIWPFLRFAYQFPKVFTMSLIFERMNQQSSLKSSMAKVPNRTISPSSQVTPHEIKQPIFLQSYDPLQSFHFGALIYKRRGQNGGNHHNIFHWNSDAWIPQILEFLQSRFTAIDSRVIPELIKNINDSFPESIIIDQIYHLKHV